MADYVLEISNYTGTVPWATHFMGRVKGEHPKSCHGGTSYNAPGHRGKTTCQEGHELPGRIEWDVEAAWTEERYERYAARHFEGDGPQQFKTEQEVIETATGRFLGALPCRWWEERVTVGQPGDKLYAGWIPVTADGQALVQENWGTVIAEVPPATSEPDAIMARPARPPHDATQRRGHAEQLKRETGPQARLPGRTSAARRDLRRTSSPDSGHAELEP